MKIILVCAVALMSLLMEGSAFAAGRLEAKFNYPINNEGRRSDAGGAVVEFYIRNAGDDPITFSTAQLPIPESNGYLTNNMLRVTDPDGNEAAYQGLYVYYSDRGKSTEKVLRPGEVRTSTVDLLKNYQLLPGVVYSVELRFGVIYGEAPGKQQDKTANSRRRSGDAGSIRVWLDPRTGTSRPPAISGGENAEISSACSTGQQSDFSAAKAAAYAHAAAAADALSNSFVYEWNQDYTDVVVTFPYNARFWRWFGPRVSPVDLADVTSDDAYVDQGVVATYFRISDDQSTPRPIVTAECDCTSEQEGKNWTAYVTPNEHYVVHTCSAFYAADMLPVGSPDANSKVGILLHEITHFNDSYWTGTNDNVDPVTQTGTYTYGEAMNLAATDKAKAVRTATNYEFYFLNYDGE